MVLWCTTNKTSKVRETKASTVKVKSHKCKMEIKTIKIGQIYACTVIKMKSIDCEKVFSNVCVLSFIAGFSPSFCEQPSSNVMLHPTRVCRQLELGAVNLIGGCCLKLEVCSLAPAMSVSTRATSGVSVFQHCCTMLHTRSMLSPTRPTSFR